MDSPGSPSAPSSAPTPSASSSPAPKPTATQVSSPTAAAPKSPPGADKLSGTQAPAGETAAERKARILKYKVDGQEKEVDLDSLPETELVKRFQMSEAAQRRMQEAAEYRKAFETFRESVKKDPFAALKDPVFGVDLEALAKQRLVEQFEQSQLPEEKRETLRLQKELEARDAELRSIREAQEQAEAQALEKQVFESTYQEFSQALEGEQVPRNRTTMRMMAEIAAEALEHGVELSPKQMASEVNERLGQVTSHSLKGLKGEQLYKRLGDDVVKEVLRYSVERVRNKPPSFAPQQTNPVVERAAQQQAQDDADDDADIGSRNRLRDMRSWKEFVRK